MAKQSTKDYKLDHDIGKVQIATTAAYSGLGFTLGTLGGSAYHFVKGMCNSTSGMRFMNAKQAIRMNSFRVGREWAVFLGTWTALEKTMCHIRQKDDQWNSVVAGTATVGLLSMGRGRGIVVASGQALCFGATIAMIHQGRKFLKSVKQEMLEERMKAANLES